MGPKSHIVLVTTHPEHVDNFGSFVGEAFGTRGYRVIEINDFNDEKNFEVLLPPITAAMRYARTLRVSTRLYWSATAAAARKSPTIRTIAEKRAGGLPEAKQLLPCDGKGLSGLPKGRWPYVAGSEYRRAAPHAGPGTPAVDTRQPPKGA